MPTPPQRTTGLDALQGTALTLGALLGIGVIALPGIAVREAGPASLAAWVALLVASIPLAATFAALGARFPGAGGVSEYARLAFGVQMQTVLGWAFFVNVSVGGVTAAGFAGTYVSDALGAGRGVALLVTGAIILTVLCLNWAGIQFSARAQLGIAAVLALILVVTVVVALPHASTANLTPFAPHGLGGVTKAVAALVWAFAGWEITASLTGEYANPRRDIARAAVVSLIVIGVLYLGIAYATVAVLGDDPGDAPLSALLTVGFGEAARPVMTVAAVLLTVGTMNTYFAGVSRMGASLAQAGCMPRWLAQDGVPRRALVVMAAANLATLVVLAVTGLSTDAMLLFITGAFALGYLVSSVAAVKLLPPGWGRVAAVLSTLVSVALLVVVGWHVLACVAIGLIGVAWRALAVRTSQRTLT